MVLLSVVLTVWVSPLFVWLTVFVGLNLLQSAFTGFCPAAMVFRKLGVKPARPSKPEMRALIAILALLSGVPAAAGTLTLAPTLVTEWKAVYGRVEARDTVPARARIGGIVADLAVSEGDSVTEGQHSPRCVTTRSPFRSPPSTRMRALQSQLATAETEPTRGEALVERGVATAQRLDQLRTTVDVTRATSSLRARPSARSCSSRPRVRLWPRATAAC